MVLRIQVQYGNYQNNQFVRGDAGARDLVIGEAPEYPATFMDLAKVAVQLLWDLLQGAEEKGWE
jgi:hypothetical protein